MKRELVLETVRRTIRKYDLIQPGDNLVVGVSGGADSVCLLHLLFYLREELGINTLAAVHVNHLYRGAEADRDQHFVEALCEKMGIFLQGLPRQCGGNGKAAGDQYRGSRTGSPLRRF